ncbi:glycoside hydrolase family 20 [Prolixibacteraceae bacterium JC049]|nr:glycoside hydrolase family 20 [Prolixibacteraceae bacterium JC049]
MKLRLMLVLMCLVGVVSARNTIIPVPQKYTETGGKCKITSSYVLDVKSLSKSFQKIAGSTLEEATSWKFKVKTANSNVISFRLNNGLNQLGDEGYQLESNGKGISVEAKTETGLFYGLQSLTQLINTHKESGTIAIPNVKIEDQPNYKWRAFMLDEARFFKGKEEVKKLLDEMAYLKMNVFHWHLVDDQGWRIEIKKYPLLTEVGSKRSNSQIGPMKWKSPIRTDEPHEGFYTQKEIKEIVEYAKARHITVMPEIDMPGHSSAAVASYTWLGTLGKDIDVPDSFRCDDIFDITKPEVYQFLIDVLDEVMELFPSKVIHIGGDEVDYKIWGKSPTIKKYMKENGIKTLPDLQIQFTNRIAHYLQSKGRRLMGWNEILGHQFDERLFEKKEEVEKELASNAVIHFWNGKIEKLEEAAQKGYSVINSTSWYTYLDYNYNSINLKKAYSFNPIPAGLDKKYHNKIEGIGCQMWGEWIPTAGNMHFMVFPRLAAYAEVAWRQPELQNYEKFRKNIEPLLLRWKNKGFTIAPMSIADPVEKEKK